MSTADLVAAFVGAYRPHIMGRLARHGIASPDGIGVALEEGERWLRAELEQLLRLPFPDQRRAPLEVFQEAMRFPTDSLAAAGLRPVLRDPQAVESLPGDHYDLAPASSQELGEAVWHAHLAWGMEKARAVVRPAVGLLSGDLMDTSRIEAAVGDVGYRLERWEGPPELRARMPVVAFVDLTHRDADDTIRLLAEAGVRVFGYGPHVDDMAMVRARTLGAADAMPRSRFFTSLPGLLPEPV